MPRVMEAGKKMGKVTGTQVESGTGEVTGFEIE